jgi:hypothetical protein
MFAAEEICAEVATDLAVFLGSCHVCIDWAQQTVGEIQHF